MSVRDTNPRSKSIPTKTEGMEQSWKREGTMPKRGHTDEQIVVLRQAEAGENTLGLYA